MPGRTSLPKMGEGSLAPNERTAAERLRAIRWQAETVCQMAEESTTTLYTRLAAIESLPDEPYVRPNPKVIARQSTMNGHKCLVRSSEWWVQEAVRVAELCSDLCGVPHV